MRIIFQLGLFAVASLATCQGIAGPADSTFSTDKAVEAASLDEYRGGFVDSTGLSVSLGIDRIVTVNGNVAAQTQVNFGDLGSLASGKTTLSADAASQLNLIQNGSATFNVQLGPGALGGTVIQNSLNNQIINNATIINASVNARGMLQAMNFQSTLSNALNTAATGR